MNDTRTIPETLVPEFSLDDRLKADCIPIYEFDLCKLLLMNDRRWPWLVLVPRVTNVVEIHDLSDDDRRQLEVETAIVAKVLAEVTECEKINTGALGNIVRQLHIHVIARNPGDANWPGPVWGFGTRVTYEQDAEALIRKLLRRFM